MKIKQTNNFKLLLRKAFDIFKIVHTYFIEVSKLKVNKPIVISSRSRGQSKRG